MTPFTAVLFGFANFRRINDLYRLDRESVGLQCSATFNGEITDIIAIGTMAAKHDITSEPVLSFV